MLDEYEDLWGDEGIEDDEEDDFEEYDGDGDEIDFFD